MSLIAIPAKARIKAAATPCDLSRLCSGRGTTDQDDPECVSGWLSKHSCGSSTYPCTSAVAVKLLSISIQDRSGGLWPHCGGLHAIRRNQGGVDGHFYDIHAINVWIWILCRFLGRPRSRIFLIPMVLMSCSPSSVICSSIPERNM